MQGAAYNVILRGALCIQHQFGKTLPCPLAHGIKVRIKSGRPMALSGVCRIHTPRGEWRTKSSVCQGATYRQPPRQRHVKLQNPYYIRATTTTDGEGEGGSQRGDVRRTKIRETGRKNNQDFSKVHTAIPKRESPEIVTESQSSLCGCSRSWGPTDRVLFL